LHADFLTGAVQLARDDGATVLASAAGRRGFAHVPLGDSDEIDLGGLTLRALATPGHTDEHLSYLLLDGARELGVFTGGSLIVGAAARTDLLGRARTDELARAQYRSLRRLATLPDDTAVWPTHGAGSFCSAPPGAERTSTIGAQKQANPLLAASDEDAFARQLVDSLGSYPSYFDRLAEVNRRGPTPIRTEPELPAWARPRCAASSMTAPSSWTSAQLGEHATRADGDLHAGRAVLDRLEVAEGAVELVVGALAHGAGDEHDDVRLRAVRDPGRSPPRRAGRRCARSRGRSSGSRGCAPRTSSSPC
jgi:glyoxylase-like metal-dependent hydrolase (beta-lactamase superfamily II)